MRNTTSLTSGTKFATGHRGGRGGHKRRGADDAMGDARPCANPGCPYIAMVDGYCFPCHAKAGSHKEPPSGNLLRPDREARWHV